MFFVFQAFGFLLRRISDESAADKLYNGKTAIQHRARARLSEWVESFIYQNEPFGSPKNGEERILIHQALIERPHKNHAK